MTSLSAPPDAKKLPEREKEAQWTGPACPCNVYNKRPSLKSHKRRDESFEDDNR